MTHSDLPPKAPTDWKAVERAAASELRKRTAQAHAQVVALLKQHASGFNERQRKRVQRLLKRGI